MGPLVEQEVLVLPWYYSLPRFLVGFVLLDLYFILCSVMWIVVFPFNFGHCVVSPFNFGHCVVSPFNFGHCVVSPFNFGHCVVSPFNFGHCVVCTSIYGF